MYLPMIQEMESRSHHMLIPSNGSVTINSDGSFTYTPDLGFVGLDTFEYTITDNSANTDDATVTITITQETDYQEGIQDFALINPPATRNMIGNYAILGNTVECITTTSGDSGSSMTQVILLTQPVQIVINIMTTII